MSSTATTTTTRMSAWGAFVNACQKERVKFVFGLPGNPVHFYKEVAEAPDIRSILVRHETSAAFMAMAYARLTNEPAVVFASPGPGASNLVAGVLEAYSGCTPMIATTVSARQATDGMGAFQELDHVALFSNVTKWSVRVPRPEKTPWVMRRAFTLATTGKPGPVFIDMPGDVGLAETDMEEYHPAIRNIRIRGDPQRISEAVELILASERPVIIAGGGIYLSRAFEELRSFAELLGIPVFTTLSGRASISEGHPLAMGLVGLYRTKVGARVFDEADLVISIGARNEEFQSGNWLLFPRGAKFIQIDIDPSEISRNWVPDAVIVGDAKLVLLDLVDSIASKVSKRGYKEFPRVQSFVKALKEYESEIDSELKKEEHQRAPIKTRMIMREMLKVFGPNTILCNENGSQDLWSYYFPFYKILTVGDSVPPAEQTAMGFGVVGAIAAKLTMPEKKVVCVTGDGAFQMFMKELPTAVQYNAPVTWVILDNKSLGWPKYQERAVGMNYIAVDFEAQPDFQKIAEANQCYGLRIEKPSEVLSALKSAVQANNEGVPAVLDFVVDPWDFPEKFHEFHQRVWGFPEIREEGEKPAKVAQISGVG